VAKIQLNPFLLNFYFYLFSINAIETFLEHMDCEGEITEARSSLTFVKEMELLSPTHGMKSLREVRTPGKDQETEIDISWAICL
jgi:hypothetical protein